jgi:hypothetical protein
MTELTIHQNPSALTEQMDYARAVSSGNLLPDSYRGKPADILIAVGLGSAMGLSPAESLYRIAVIKGKPSASAELIAANVRKAGHKLRVRGDEQSATATIIRADDPDFPFEVTRDLAWAQRMGLASNDNYKKQPGTMLQWRAISAVARLACPEALYGVAYTPDELAEGERPAPQPQATTGADRVRNVLRPTEPEPVDVTDAEVIPDPDDPDNVLTDKTRKQMFAELTKHGITDPDVQRAGMSKILGRTVESRSSLTEDEARSVILELQARVA